MPRFLHKRVRTPDGKRAVIREALRAAQSSATDECAREQLAQKVLLSSSDAHAALKFFSDRRDRFDMDRAYRLLVAAIASDHVEPVPASRREQFAREEWLGRLPLDEAFAFLAAHDQRLETLAAVAANSREESPTADGLPARMPPPPLLPSASDDMYALLHESPLARSIATQYLSILDGSDTAEPSASYFALRRKAVVLVTTFDGR